MKKLARMNNSQEKYKDAKSILEKILQSVDSVLEQNLTKSEKLPEKHEKDISSNVVFKAPSDPILGETQVILQLNCTEIFTKTRFRMRLTIFF